MISYFLQESSLSGRTKRLGASLPGQASFARPMSLSEKYQINKWDLKNIYDYFISTTCAPNVCIPDGFDASYCQMFVEHIFSATSASRSVHFHTFTILSSFQPFFFTFLLNKLFDHYRLILSTTAATSINYIINGWVAAVSLCDLRFHAPAVSLQLHNLLLCTTFLVCYPPAWSEH